MISSVRYLTSTIIASILALCSLNGQFTISQNTFDESYTDLNLDIGEEFSFRSTMTNNSNDTLLINWEIIEINHPEEWFVTVTDIQISYVLNLLIEINNGTPPHPMTFTPNLKDGLFTLGFNPRTVDGCVEAKLRYLIM